jgi:hypothetical protein
MAFSTDQITITGTGSLSIPNMPSASSLNNIVVYNSGSGQFSYTSSAAIVESGTFTPTLDNPTGACSNVALTKAHYSRVGNIVTCTIYGTVDFDFLILDSGFFNFTYPFTPSSNNSIGTCGVGSIIGRLSSIVFLNKIEFTSDSSITYSDVVFTAIFQYEID